MSYGTDVNDTLNEDGVIDNEPSSLQLCMGHKSWAATSDIHIGFWLAERAAHGVWLEGIDDIPPSCLVDELEGDLVCEWPLEDVVKFSTHHHKEQ